MQPGSWALIRPASPTAIFLYIQVVHRAFPSAHVQAQSCHRAPRTNLYAAEISPGTRSCSLRNVCLTRFSASTRCPHRGPG
ncbi:hypothetical protein B0T26DRAFT_505986 [Lasiosphaeria miniovina]|uniref:Uncharacterized protein n=1 Tax=Lasiosphaeria miniovina TaxID=1954250 RepID=A0AA39ZTR6_9PEZI|nr:uncharacterized protein B0T26DRAFT_505986 [Lasiosphaeria miniovina]KAK0703574.1 hypothetical protein B0T26DRAFT_505986 [Lasiosphaeria miniovina]